MSLPVSLAISEQDKLKKLFDIGYFAGKEWDSVRALAIGSAQVKEAVEKYRDFHGLPPGDTVDERTTTDLFMPRCGLPDFVRPEGAALCKWSFLDVSCAMLLYGLKPLVDGVEDGLFDLALASWNEVCGLNLTRIASMTTANIYSEVGNTSSGVLAYSYLPCGNTSRSTRLQQVYSKNTNWSEALLLNVLVHEIGHAIGLDHLQAPNLMQPTANGTVTRPQKGDIEAAQARYGKPKPKPPAPDPVPPSGQRIVIPSGTVLTAGEYVLTPVGEHDWNMEPIK